MVDQVTLVDGSVITDDTNPTTGIRAGGHRNWFIKALQSVSTWASRAQSYAAQAQAAAGAGGGTIFPAVTNALAGKILTLNQAGTAYDVIAPNCNTLVINGNFDVWQLGTSISNPTNTANMYGPDGWYFFRPGFVTGVTCSQIVDGVKVQRTAADTSTSQISLAQSFETVDVKKWAGKTVTVQAKILKGANFSGGTLTFALNYGTGTNGNVASGFTGYASVAVSPLSLTTTKTLYTLTAAIPANATQLSIEFK